MSTLVSVLIIITCLLLILVVLVQNSKGGGLSSQFSASNQVMGVKKTSELIEKITWALAIALVIFCVATTFTGDGKKTQLQDTELREKIDNGPAGQQPQPQAAPAAGTPAPGAGAAK
jgi:preprotein translocase subunit SecG